jgi:hypothetical protein
MRFFFEIGLFKNSFQKLLDFAINKTAQFLLSLVKVYHDFYLFSRIFSPYVKVGFLNLNFIFMLLLLIFIIIF